jgi:hypothetical protein
MNKLSEDAFKTELQQLEKNKNKKNDFNNIYQMFVDVSSDIFRQIIICFQGNGNSQQHHVIVKCLEDNMIIFRNLRNYFNETIKKIANSYKCVYPGITDTFRFESNYKTHLAHLETYRNLN